MTSGSTATFQGRSRRLRALGAALLILAVAAIISQAPAMVRMADAQAASTSLVVKDAGTGQAIWQFKFVVNEDNVGDPNDPNNTPSIRPGASHSPVALTGDETGAQSLNLPDGKYLVSVEADGYKLGGEHFTDPAGTVTVLLQPEPLPLSKVRVHVFHDDHPVNGENDIPVESDLAGFEIVLDDAVGEVTQDYFGNPLGTRYEKDANGDFVFDADGNPIPIPDTGGRILTDANGDALIENLPPNKYEVRAIPPDGEGWIQTTTIEGTHAIDAWVEEGNDGYGAEEGFQMPLVWFGFVKEKAFDNPGAGTVRGRIRATTGLAGGANQPPVMGEPVYKPYIALTDIGGNDQQVYTGRGNADGTFEITGVPDSTYQMAIWDEPLDYIISFRTVIVKNGATVDMGDIGIPRWFGWIQGSVFNDDGMDAAGNAIGPDAAGNGIRDCTDPANRSTCEQGISGMDLDTRFKDGSIQYTALTDRQGRYSFDEVFELEKFAVSEVGFGRFARTGASVRDSSNPGVVKSTHDGALLLPEITWAGQKNLIDWGKRAYNDNENGGISGIVYYATTRNEQNARYAAAEDYEPGIPGVTVKLYATVDADNDGQPDTDPQTGAVVKGDLLNTVQTDSWTHPNNCEVQDANDPNNVGPGCIEAPLLATQVKDGVFDGGYAFEEDSQGNPLQPGKYVVEVVPPEGYKIVKEEDVNTDKGENFVPQVPPPPCAGALHAVDDPRNPYDGQQMPLCDSKLVQLSAQQNAASDFFLFTDVPVAGRIVGLMTDDLNVELDPNALYYGDKRGVPNAPVGIRDYTGRLIKTVYTDKNGVFEVTLPSTATTNVPTPSGVSPGMYRVIGNDPGDPDNPNPGYNPNYQTLPLVFDVWPGKTTYADVAIFPITGFVKNPGSQFKDPPQCEVAGGRPQIWTVSRPYVPASGDRSFIIKGISFGSSPRVTIGGRAITVNSVSADRRTIRATVPASFPAGPGELLVSSGGRVSPTGLTFHVLGGTGASRYAPGVVTVNPGQKIQDAIDAAPDNGRTLIVVNPGTYYENLILHKDVKLQGLGAGGMRVLADGRVYAVPGANIDGRFSNPDAWAQKLAGLAFDGNQDVRPGAAITVVASDGEFTQGFATSIDGFKITGARGAQGGGVYVNAFGRYLQIANNVIQSNGGGFGGGVTLGRAYAGDNQNDSVRVHHNRILNNGGISLAGAVGIFNGARNYEVDRNEVCGNYSAEYGGGISQFGYSPGGRIHHNDILFNYSFDEGGGVLVGGEQPLPPAAASQGSGAVDIYANRVQGNLSNDDGGGIRLLKPMNYQIDITNNMVVNNVATDLGGGLALDDAPKVTLVNNTVARNMTTATAEDSDGNPHAAGLASESHSAALMAQLPAGSADFSDPVQFNNVFWDNRAGRWDGTGLVGLGLAGDTTPIKRIDLEVFGTATTEFMKPRYSILSVPYGGSNATNKVGVNPLFVSPYLTSLTAVPFRGDPAFITVIVNSPTPGAVPGNYHLRGTSPAIDAGGGSFGGVPAPTVDYDGNNRPFGPRWDMGADEFVR